MGNVLREVFQHQNSPAHPVLHAAGGQIAGLLHGRLKILADGVALQIVVVEGEQSESQDHDARGGQQDLWLNLRFISWDFLCKSGDAFRDATFHVQRRRRSDGRSTLVHACLTSLSARFGENLALCRKCTVFQPDSRRTACQSVRRSFLGDCFCSAGCKFCSP